MVPNRLAIVVLGIACVSAAAAGGYFATRQNAANREPTVNDTVKAAGPARATAAPEAAAVLAAEPKAAAADPSIVAAKAPEAKSSKGTSAVTGASHQPPARLPAQAPTNAVVLPPAPAPVAATPEPPAPVACQEDPPAEPVKVPEPEKVPEKSFTDLVVASDAVIGLQMETTVTSERARVEDRVDARVIRDVRVSGEVAIPSGSHAIGSVMAVDRGGKFKDRARIGIRFNTLVLADGTRLPITTETIYRYGEAPGNSSAAKIGGGAVGGAILGAILGGAKGAAIGAAAGAGGGAAATEAGDRHEATFVTGTQLTARFLSPVTVTVEK